VMLQTGPRKEETRRGNGKSFPLCPIGQQSKHRSVNLSPVSEKLVSTSRGQCSNGYSEHRQETLDFPFPVGVYQDDASKAGFKHYSSHQAHPEVKHTEWSTPEDNSCYHESMPVLECSPARCPSCNEEIKKPANNYIALGPKGQRDVRWMADPEAPCSCWRFYHIKCVKEIEKHAPAHPLCERPTGPCTDWHLRGKCKRGFKCGHCHLEHKELLDKYPDLPPGGVLRRSQRRERLQALRTSYEDDVKKFL